MLPGPVFVVACPHCGSLATYGTLTSGNTMGAQVWTDGYGRAPMLPRPPNVVICQGCERSYWLSDAEEVGVLPFPGEADPAVDPSWLEAPDVEEPTEAQYYRALEDGLATSDDEQRALRTLAWWRRNDEHRDLPPEEADASFVVDGPCRRNLEALVRLLDREDEDQAIVRAEVFRELGDFEASLDALGPVTSRQHVGLVGQIRSLCAERKTAVREHLYTEATCPVCDKPLRTPFARQCRFCGADWHS